MAAYEIRCRLSDEEIIESYLRPKMKGELYPVPRFIVELDEELYTREPWLLPHQADPILNPREWFYLGKRNPKYRQAEGVVCEGSWIPESGCVEIVSEEEREVIGGTMRFRYHFRNKEAKVSGMERSNWFMREYRLYNKDKRGLHKRQVFCIITCNDSDFI